MFNRILSVTILSESFAHEKLICIYNKYSPIGKAIDFTHIGGVQLLVVRFSAAASGADAHGPTEEPR